MAHFSKMDKGGRDGGRGNFKSGGRSFDRDSRPKMMHSATCDNCHKSCEVPFRPTGDKPVYCKDCFTANGPSTDGFRKKETRDFTPSTNTRTTVPQAGNDELKKQLEAVNAKLERLIFAVHALATPREEPKAKIVVAEKAPAKAAKVAVKKPAKKVAKKGPIKR